MKGWCTPRGTRAGTFPRFAHLSTLRCFPVTDTLNTQIWSEIDYLFRKNGILDWYPMNPLAYTKSEVAPTELLIGSYDWTVQNDPLILPDIIQLRVNMKIFSLFDALDFEPGVFRGHPTLTPLLANYWTAKIPSYNMIRWTPRGTGEDE